jgi:hypothetical protein
MSQPLFLIRERTGSCATPIRSGEFVLILTTVHAPSGEPNRLICLAGASAQRRFAPRSIRGWHSHGDYQKAVDISSHMCGSNKEENAYLRWLQVRSDNLVETYWLEIDAVAKALLKHRTLNGEEIVRAITSAGREVK